MAAVGFVKLGEDFAPIKLIEKVNAVKTVGYASIFGDEVEELIGFDNFKLVEFEDNSEAAEACITFLESSAGEYQAVIVAEEGYLLFDDIVYPDPVLIKDNEKKPVEISIISDTLYDEEAVEAINKYEL